MSIQDTLFLLGWYLFLALVIAATHVVLWSILPSKIKSVFEAKISPLTMSLGLWLIGDRKTPMEKKEIEQSELRYDLLCSCIVDRDATAAGRDAAINERDTWRATAEQCAAKLSDAVMDRDTARGTSEALARGQTEMLAEHNKLSIRYSRLRKRYNTLRDRTISKTPKRKAKAKTKR